MLEAKAEANAEPNQGQDQGKDQGVVDQDQVVVDQDQDQGQCVGEAMRRNLTRSLATTNLGRAATNLGRAAEHGPGPFQAGAPRHS
jgi:hypothetical protein